jgi:hypothetical protein
MWEYAGHLGEQLDQGGRLLVAGVVEASDLKLDNFYETEEKPKKT